MPFIGNYSRNRYVWLKDILIVYVLCFIALKRIEKVKTASEGTLYGLTDNDTIFLIGFSLGATPIEDNLPIGLAECGRIKWNRIARPGGFDWTKVRPVLMGALSISY